MHRAIASRAVERNGLTFIMIRSPFRSAMIYADAYQWNATPSNGPLTVRSVTLLLAFGL
jgi:hypothetical protein